ncbi:MAG: CHRD domain-containing protein [Marmoricola sp.]
MLRKLAALLLAVTIGAGAPAALQTSASAAASGTTPLLGSTAIAAPPALAAGATPEAAAATASATPGPSCTTTVSNGTAQCVTTYVCPAERCTIDVAVAAKARLFLRSGSATVTSAQTSRGATCTPKAGKNACSAATGAISLTSGQSAELRCVAVPDVFGLGGGTAACSSTVTEDYLVHLRAHLTGAAEVPAVATAATAEAEVTVNVKTGEICYSVPASGLSSSRTATTLHRGPTYATGPVIRLTNTTADSFCATASTTGPEQPNAFDLAANPTSYYVNVHTLNYPAGEIRGQLEPVS